MLQLGVECHKLTSRGGPPQQNQLYQLISQKTHVGSLANWQRKALNNFTIRSISFSIDKYPMVTAKMSHIWWPYAETRQRSRL